MDNKSIRYLKGVGEARAKLFEKKNIKTITDLLYFFPKNYEDRTKCKPIAQVSDGETVCIEGVVFAPVKEKWVRKNLTIQTMVLFDDSGNINAMWYNNKYLKNKFMAGEKYIFYGKIELKNGKKTILNPVFERPEEKKITGKIVPVYPLTDGLSQKIVQSAMEQAMESARDLDDTLPDYIREKYKLAHIGYAMQNIHFPKTFDDYEIARRRFVFEELFILQLALNLQKMRVRREDGNAFADINCVNDFLSKLPFKLTNAQNNALNEILRDMTEKHPMNRLVQGDVGSGKTVVAAGAMYTAVKNGFQAAIMAPTEILAAQHFETFSEFFKDTDINILLLTGSMTAKEKRLANEQILLGTADIIVGTHAIIQEKVEYKNLGLVVADEQHRFGVNQRAALAKKGAAPHVLIMTATPIPRTLALILYGDLDLSIIDELPPGRKPVKTYAVGENMRQRIFKFIEKNVDLGTQVYIVCPLIEETEKTDLQNAENLADKLRTIFPKMKIGLLHGKMRAAEKDGIMNEFAEGRINVLVSTTVIEVGVNVPNANIMIIENAERFGLSQLHQLRGRVGRGKNQAYCVLFAHGNNEVTKKRMETMCESNDGFYISEQDLKLRGPGDFFGVRQHGLPEMKIANLFSDMDILKQAQKAVSDFMQTKNIDDYPNLKLRTDSIFSEDIAMN